MSKTCFVFIGSILSGFITLIKPTFPFMVIVMVLVVFDIISSFQLQQHLFKLGKLASKPKIEGSRLLNALNGFGRMLFYILIAFFVDQYIFSWVNLFLPNWTAGICCFVLLYSILENHIATNDSKISKLLKHLMIDKTAKLINISMDELNSTINDDNSETNKSI